MGILTARTHLNGLGMSLENVWNGHSNDLQRLEWAGDGLRKGLEWAF